MVIKTYFLVRSQPATLLTKFMTCKKNSKQNLYSVSVYWQVYVANSHVAFFDVVTLGDTFICHEGWLKSPKSPKAYLHNC